MKTRIVHTKIWEDEWFGSIPRASKLLFLYLITCPQNNICGIFEICDRVLMFNSGLNQVELEQAKKDLEGRVIFYQSWVKLTKSNKYNNYVTSPKLEVALKRELDLIPEVILKYMNGYDTSIHTSIYTPINHKSKIINNNKGGVGGFGNLESLTNEHCIQLSEHYQISTTAVLELREELKLYCAANGKRYKNYSAALQNWIRRRKQEGVYVREN